MCSNSKYIISTQDDYIQIVGSREYKKKIRKKDFFDEWFTRIANGKFVRAFEFGDNNTLHIEWASSEEDSLEEINVDYIFDGVDEEFLNKLDILVRAFQNNEEQNRQNYEEEVAKAKALLDFRKYCYRIMEDYSKDGSVGELEYNLRDIVRYIKTHSRPHWIKLARKRSQNYKLNEKILKRLNYLLMTGAWTFLLIGNGLFSIFFGVGSIFVIFAERMLATSSDNDLYAEITRELEYISEHPEDNVCPENQKAIQENIRQEVFYSLMRDIEFMRTHPEYDFSSEVAKVKELSQDLMLSKEKETREDGISFRNDLMRTLLDIEMNIYSKETKTGRKNEIDALLGWDDLRNRLCYVFDVAIYYFEEEFMEKMKYDLDVLLDNLYYGVEVDVLGLYKIALDYFKERSKYSREEEFRQTQVYEWLASKKENFKNRALARMNAAYNYSKLDALLDDIERQLREDLIGCEGSLSHQDSEKSQKAGDKSNEDRRIALCLPGQIGTPQ